MAFEGIRSFATKVLGRKDVSNNTETEAKRNADKEQVNLSDRGRRSTAYPAGVLHTKQYRSYYGFLAPDETGSWKWQQIDPNRLKYYPVSRVLDIIIQNVGAISKAVMLWKHYIYQGYELVCDNERAINVISDFIMKSEVGSSSFHNKMEMNAYNMIVQGAYCTELYFSEDGEEPLDIAPVEPFTLRYRWVDGTVHNGYWQTGQYDKQFEFIVLQDRMEPNECFTLDPVGQRSGKPYGTSVIASAIFETLFLRELMDTMMVYTKGQAIPKGLISVDASDILNSDLVDEETDLNAINAYLEGASENIKTALDATDESQMLVLSDKVVYTLLGALNKANLDAVDMLTDILTQDQRRGTKIPRIMDDTDRGGSLGESESRVEVATFKKLVQPFQMRWARALEKDFNVILRHTGILDKLEVKPKLVDEEGYRNVSERLKIDAETYEVYQRNGWMTEEEIRRLTVISDDRFEGMSPMLPEELMLRNEQNRMSNMTPDPEGGTNPNE